MEMQCLDIGFIQSKTVFVLISKESCNSVETMILEAGYILFELTRVECCGKSCLVASAECTSKERGS